MTSIPCGNRVIELGARTAVMGIVNITPDSFSDGGLHDSVAAAVAHAESLVAAGADILDLGGESTRPGAVAVAPDVERARVLPVVEALVRRGITALSIDTRNASTAAACLDAGAVWINDVSALRHDPDMPRVAARAQGVVLMHWPVDWTAAMPDARGDRVVYGDVLAEVHAFLAARVQAAVAAGVDSSRIVVDPGLGFGKSVDDNVRLLRHAGRFAGLGAVLLGPSRKRFLGALTGVDDPRGRDAATLGAVTMAAVQGAHIVRVHDVAGAVQALRVADAVLRAHE